MRGAKCRKACTWITCLITGLHGTIAPTKAEPPDNLSRVVGGSVSGLGRAYAIAVLLVAKPAFNVIVTQVHFLYKTQVVNLCYQQRYIALPQKDARGDLPV